MKNNITAFLVTVFIMISGALISFGAFPVAHNSTKTVATTNVATTTNAEITAQMEEYSNAVGVARTQAPVAPEAQGNRSWIAAVLLCFFLGGLGIHRFYLGYTWQGVVQLFTAGGCGIWVLIDFIRILTKDLGPKDGRYY
jgi:hypothetical protein